MRVVGVVMILCASAIVHGQSALQEMVKTEQAFSKTAETKNTRDAFMQFIADDGLLFRPGAVNGKKWMLEHPVPPSDKKPLLAWQPAFAGMAASGDMGFTTGPWEAKTDIKDEKPAAYGHFVTVWKKQSDGTWKFVVDLGISHPQSGGPQTLWLPVETKAKSPAKPDPDFDARTSLLSRDRKYAAECSTHDLPKVFAGYAAPEVRLYREGSLPFIGRQAAAEALSKATGRFNWTAIAADVSQAGDFGYTHGTYEVADADRKVVAHGSYVRIWQVQAGVWRIVLEVINAH
jgi:ketosteroid isomerase-like protein